MTLRVDRALRSIFSMEAQRPRRPNLPEISPCFPQFSGVVFKCSLLGALCVPSRKRLPIRGGVRPGSSRRIACGCVGVVTTEMKFRVSETSAREGYLSPLHAHYL